jgi:hypothetical protein
MTITRDEWINRCVNRYLERSSISTETARGFAETCYDMREGWFENAPEDAADSDMSYWD